MAERKISISDANLDEAIDDLCRLSQDLNQRTDALNSWLRSIEERMAEGGVGIECWLRDGVAKEYAFVPADFEADAGYWAWSIGWTRFQSGWRLGARRILYSQHQIQAGKDAGEVVELANEDYAEEMVPLLNAPRRVRAAARKVMPALIEKIRETAATDMEELESIDFKVTKNVFKNIPRTDPDGRDMPF